MNATATCRTFVLTFGLALLAAAPRAWGQSTNADAIARKAYSARHDRVYFLGGGALPNYTKLNDRLAGTNFPKLKPGAVMFGAGYGQGSGSFALALEWRLLVRANDLDSSKAYTNLLTNTIGLMGRYNLLVTDRYTVSVLAGPTYNRLNLTLKEPPARKGESAAFDAQVQSGGNKRKLYQSQFGFGGGVQLERHFEWLRRNDVQACGRARQITAGLRLQYDYIIKDYRWHTERPLFRPNFNTKLERKPSINPVGLSASLVVGGIFNRY
ncbi:MAG: hypothetical protein H7330_01280 [Hymenobacteraceae bacterium]|nr:hypothetical protein [Hymenobacteraceae bacterium]